MEWINQLVGRKSYGCDVLFRVVDVVERDGEEVAILFGSDIRLVADAPVADLTLMTEKDIERIEEEWRSQEEESFHSFKNDTKKKEQRNNSSSSQSFHLPGKVLHLDGDPQYLNKCIDAYSSLGVPVVGIHCQEQEMPERVAALIEKYQPQILVLTGHDAYLPSRGKKTDINSYRNSAAFVKAVQTARRKMPSLDQLVIFAGACQSHFESLIHAGANFASSPLRVNIHALDPVYTVGKVSYTSFKESVFMEDILQHTLADEDGIGGVETKGVLRTGTPYRAEMYTE
ncbi:sporulation peptidase YabG [Jeotgalibacillus sp. ET6]|uniref:sporulation peptidase YabG n=1 Tax=Jeotgalibacillus sp. ET6 TaxID=3037260 RepID=UPI002418B297|nr:sporulation peptidase YabG [Jeotgalibacillus sp. ET6]MDG5473837.1 sporulation peptidase YabG [Jeotgalibacillus sp. ET6]